MGTEFILAGMKAQWEECGGRILLSDNRRPIGFQCAGVWIKTRLPSVHTYLNVRVLNVRLVSDIPERNYCLLGVLIRL